VDLPNHRFGQKELPAVQWLEPRCDLVDLGPEFAATFE
jgi:hypothetical protein